MIDTQNIDSDALMVAVQFANKCVDAEFAPYHLEIAADVVRGKNVLWSKHWCDQVQAYYHGATLGSAAAKQQQSGQVVSSTAPTDSVTKTTTLPTVDDFLAAWAPRFGMTVRERADVAVQLVHGEVAPLLAAKDALLASQSAQIAELQAKLVDTLNAVRNRVIHELDNKRDDVGHYRVRECDVVKVIDEAIGTANGPTGGNNEESKKVTRAAYQQLVNENLVWLLKQPRTLKRDHIEAIVRASVVAEYPLTMTAPPCGPCQGSGKLWDSNWSRFDKCGFCGGIDVKSPADTNKPCTNNGRQEQQPSKYDITEKDPAKRAEMVAACLNERGVLRAHGHPKARAEVVNDQHMVRFTARVSHVVDLLEQEKMTILQLAMEIEVSDEAYRRGRDTMQQARN